MTTMDDGNDGIFYSECPYWQEVLVVNAIDKEEVFVAIFTERRYSFKDRVRHCWRILRHGEPYGDQVVLSNSGARQLGCYLLDVTTGKDEANATEEE